LNEVSQLRSEVAALQSELQTWKNQNQLLQLDISQTKDQQTIEDETEAKRIRELGLALENDFSKEKTNSYWSARTQSLIHEALANDQMQVDRVECRSAMCRVQLSATNHLQTNKMLEFSMKINKELPNIMTREIALANGAIATVLFLSKNDFEVLN
jgi:hypothetical protein